MAAPWAAVSWNSSPIIDAISFIYTDLLVVIEIIRGQDSELGLIREHDEKVLTISGMWVMFERIDSSSSQSSQRPENPCIALLDLDILALR
jgi:hypothetical protein